MRTHKFRVEFVAPDEASFEDLKNYIEDAIKSSKGWLENSDPCKYIEKVKVMKG